MVKKMKQINGFKFSNPNKEHKVKITDNNGNIQIYTEQEADEIYRILYAQKYADKIFDDTIKKLGINKVLVTCVDSNIGSKKIIEANGGILENKIFFEPENDYICRYYIKL